MNYKIACVIVTYNGEKWIKDCIESVIDNPFPMDIYVIDNGSTDGTKDIINFSFPQIEFIESKKNLGFGKANNLGIQLALKNNVDALFLLNQDAYLYNLNVEEIISYLFRYKDIGVISPIHLAGNKSDIDFGFAEYLRPSNTPLILKDVLYSQKKEFYPTEFVNAAAWVVKASVLKEIGGFHPIFDHYGEDNEFVDRLKKAGYKINISTNNFIIHDRPQSRSENKYFTDYNTLIRISLIQSMKSNFVSKGYSSIALLFFKSSLKEIFKGKFRTAYFFLKGYFIYKKKINLVKKGKITPYLSNS